MRPLKTRQGAIGGLAVALMGAAGTASQSTEPLETFGFVLAVGLACVLLVTAVATAINRQLRRPG